MLLIERMYACYFNIALCKIYCPCVISLCSICSGMGEAAKNGLGRTVVEAADSIHRLQLDISIHTRSQAACI